MFNKHFCSYNFSFIFSPHRGEDLYALVVIAIFIDKKISKHGVKTHQGEIIVIDTTDG